MTVKETPSLINADVIFHTEHGFPGAYDYWYSKKNPDYQIIIVDPVDENPESQLRYAIFDDKGEMLGDFYDKIEEAINALVVYVGL